MGTLGFLIPWHFNEYKEAITQVMLGNFALVHRMRLAVSVHTTAPSSTSSPPSTSSSRIAYCLVLLFLSLFSSTHSYSRIYSHRLRCIKRCCSSRCTFLFGTGSMLYQTFWKSGGTPFPHRPHWVLKRVSIFTVPHFLSLFLMAVGCAQGRIDRFYSDRKYSVQFELRWEYGTP